MLVNLKRLAYIKPGLMVVIHGYHDELLVWVMLYVTQFRNFSEGPNPRGSGTLQ